MLLFLPLERIHAAKKDCSDTTIGHRLFDGAGEPSSTANNLTRPFGNEMGGHPSLVGIGPGFLEGTELVDEWLQLISELRTRGIDGHTHIPELIEYWNKLVAYARQGLRLQVQNFLESEIFRSIPESYHENILRQLVYDPRLGILPLSFEYGTEIRKKQIETLHQEIQRVHRRGKLTYRRFFYAWFKLSVLLTPKRFRDSHIRLMENFDLEQASTDFQGNPRILWKMADQLDLLAKLENGDFNEFWMKYRKFEAYVSSPRRHRDVGFVSDWYLHKSLYIVNQFPDVVAFPVPGELGKIPIRRAGFQRAAPVGIPNTVFFTEGRIWFSDYFAFHDMDHWTEIFENLGRTLEERLRLRMFGKLLDRHIVQLEMGERRGVETLLFNLIQDHSEAAVDMIWQEPTDIKAFLTGTDIHISEGDLPNELIVNDPHAQWEIQIEYRDEAIDYFVPIFMQIAKDLRW